MTSHEAAAITAAALKLDSGEQGVALIAAHPVSSLFSRPGVGQLVGVSR